MGGKTMEFQQEINQFTIIIGELNRLTSENFYIKEGEQW